MQPRTRVVILGAGGRDFHVFNTRYRHDPTCEVVAFTAAQIPHIDHRGYPPVLSGALYPEGIPIHPESDLERLVREESVDDVVFAYSDVPLGELDRLAERVHALGARFGPFDPAATQLPSARACVAAVPGTSCAWRAIPTTRHAAW